MSKHCFPYSDLFVAAHFDLLLLAVMCKYSGDVHPVAIVIFMQTLHQLSGDTCVFQQILQT